MHNTNLTLFQAFQAVAKKYPLKEIIYFKQSGSYKALSYQTLYQEVTTKAYLLKACGINKDDHVAIILDNSPYWAVAFLACMCIAAVIVPINPQLEHQELLDILSHSESKIILTNRKLSAHLKEIIKNAHLRILCLDSEDVVNPAASAKAQDFTGDGTKDTILSCDLASIVYTSGTTATPKGVKSTHENLLSNVDSIQKLRFLNTNDCIISLLPFYHSYPFMVNLLFPLLTTIKISFPYSLDIQDIMECIKETNVTILVSVPRLLELLKKNIQQVINQLPTIGKWILQLSLGLSLPLRKYLHINSAKLIMHKAHRKFGLRFRYVVCGGAKLDESTARQFYRWGFTILEGYGLTESSPLVSFNLPKKFKIGSAGLAIPGVEIKIHKPDEEGMGEVIIRGKNITTGYYKDEILTHQRIKNNWFFTGDLGHIDRTGFLYIHHRKDETIVLSSGKKINPQELEDYYLQSPFIKELCVFLKKDTDTSKDILSAVILPEYEQLRRQGVYQIKDRIRWEIENLSYKLPSYQRIKHYTVINENLARTPLGKLKRYLIQEKYQKQSQELKSAHPLSQEDKELLSYPLCKKAYDLLCKESKKEISLNDNLEIDLGFDSLEQIALFVELQKIAGDIEFSDEDLTKMLTVGDVLNKLKNISLYPYKETMTQTSSWQKILTIPIEDNIKESIYITQNILQKMINYFLIGISRLVTLILFRVEVKGKENLPSQGPVIICSNHASYLDGPLLFAQLKTQSIINTYFVGYKIYFDHPLISWAKKLLRLISIDASLELTNSLQICSYVFKYRKILCIFPEGMRSLDGNIQEFKKGLGIIIKELNIPVIPLYIKGSFKAWPAYKILPKPNKITIAIGKKLSPQELVGQRQKDDIDIYKNIMHTLREKIIELKNTI